MMHRSMLAVVFFAATCAIAAERDPKSSSEAVVGTVIDFTAAELGPHQRGFLDDWRWTPEVREQASIGSRVEVVADAAARKSALRVRVTDGSIFARGPLMLLRLAPFYPPETDALRLQLKVLRGKVRISAGGPTAYYANSDVYTRSGEVVAADVPQWTTLDLSLNHPLRRNFRRAGFSTDAARIHYNRWSQEPIGIFLDAGTDGEFLLDRIELIATGEGRPFPTFADRDVKLVQRIADFNEGLEGRGPSVWNTYMADGETEWFEQSWLREKPLRFTPATFAAVDDAERGSKVLAVTGPWAEEVQCVGLLTANGADANAVQFAVRQESVERRNTVVGLGRAEPVDVLLFVLNNEPESRWGQFAAPQTLREGRTGGFDLQFSYRAIRDQANVHVAIYQTRRYVRPQEWTKLTIPLADFVCIYGSGALRERYLHREPVRGDEIDSIAWLNPWTRVGRNGTDVTLKLDDVAFVRVPGTAAEHRSFWQLPEDVSPEWRTQPGPYGGSKIMLLPGDAWQGAVSAIVAPDLLFKSWDYVSILKENLMATKTSTARKPARAGTRKNTKPAKSKAAKKSGPGMLARAAASVTATVKNIGARRATRQAKVMHFLADNMIVGKETAQNLAKKADARAARRQKAARAATRKAAR